MNKCKLSIMNSIIAGILICGMLAAFGAAEQRRAAPDMSADISQTELSNIPEHIANTF